MPLQYLYTSSLQQLARRATTKRKDHLDADVVFGSITAPFAVVAIVAAILGIWVQHRKRRAGT